MSIRQSIYPVHAGFGVKRMYADRQTGEVYNSYPGRPRHAKAHVNMTATKNNLVKVKTEQPKQVKVKKGKGVEVEEVKKQTDKWYKEKPKSRVNGRSRK